MKCLLFRAAVLASAVGLIAAGQSTETLHFDVASVKPNNSKLYAAGGSQDPGRSVYTNWTLMSCIMYAWKLLGYQVTGPAWLDTERYDIVATRPPGTTEDQSRRMLQSLLIERFGLKLRWEKRRTEVYGLVAAKGGPKLTEVADDGEPTIRFNPQGIDGNREPMSALAAILMRWCDLPVIDMTGAAGLYKFTVKWKPDPDQKAGALPDPAMLSALQEQLGLSLEPRRAELDHLVIDYANKAPGEN